MKSIQTFWQQCTTFEKVWCLTFTIVGLVASIFKDTPPLNIIATLLGMWCVFLVAKCHTFNFHVGTVYVTIHAFISWRYELYFMTMLYLGFYLPLQYIGWRHWRKHPPLYTIKNEHIVIRQLFPRGWLAIFISLIIISLIHVQLLYIYHQDSETLPWDSLILVYGISGQLLMTWRFVEQWVCWICLNIANCLLWFFIFASENDAVWILLVMWTLKIINAIYGWHNWKKIQKQQSSLVSGPYCPYTPQFTRHY